MSPCPLPFVVKATPTVAGLAQECRPRSRSSLWLQASLFAISSFRIFRLHLLASVCSHRASLVRLICLYTVCRL